MKPFIFAAALLCSTSVFAQERASPTCDWDLRGVGTPRFGTCPTEKGEAPAPVVNVDKAAWEHARQTDERLREEGGCNAPNLPVEYAAYCFNGAINSANKNGPVGASSGGSGD